MIFKVNSQLNFRGLEMMKLFRITCASQNAFLKDILERERDYLRLVIWIRKLVEI